jgi:DNA repair exonuclease SbcCD ATPase subunit
MSLGDDEKRELIERRLIERVATEARSRLFGSYVIVGTVVISLLGYVGYNIIKSMEQAAIAAATARVDEVVRQRVEPLITDIDAKLDQASEGLRGTERLLDQSRTRLELSDELGAEMRRKLERAAETAAEARDQATRLLDSVNQDIDTAKERIEELARRLDLDRARFETFFADASSVQQAFDTLDGVIEQVKALGSQVEALAMQAATPAERDYGFSQTQLATLQTSTQEKLESERAARATAPVVFFQFAGMPRPQAREIAAALASLGYEVPGEEQVAGAAGLAEVRFFHTGDAVVASRLAEGVAATLERLGLPAKAISARDFTSYKGAKPKPGVVELWLGL